jgi:hypothetical protein
MQTVIIAPISVLWRPSRATAGTTVRVRTAGIRPGGGVIISIKDGTNKP